MTLVRRLSSPNNHVTIDGNTDLTVSDDACARFASYGWHTIACDGHDPIAIRDSLTEANAQTNRPTLISLRTIIGHGSPTREGTNAAHSGPLGKEELEQLRLSLGWEHAPFVIPDQVRQMWRKTTQLGKQRRLAWGHALEQDPERKAIFTSMFDKSSEPGTVAALQDLKRKQITDQHECATRFASLKAIEAIRPLDPSLVGGAADVTISTFTKPEGIAAVQKNNFEGSHIHYGVREHAMGAMMNGMALHGGIKPYGGTYLCFLDYARPAVRMSAMMGLGVIYICTHDSIGAGDDGPTHQAIEQIGSLRGMPNVLVMRPADSVETTECWQIALQERSSPTILMLAAQGWPTTPTGLPTLRKEYTDANLCAYGAYVVSPAIGSRDITILSTGSEVSIAIEAQKQLSEKGIQATVVSMPCWELFERQSKEYRNTILGDAPRIAVEAATPFGWARYVANENDVIGVRTFGVSAGYQDLYRHFGITADAVAAKAQQVISNSGPHRTSTERSVSFPRLET